MLTIITPATDTALTTLQAVRLELGALATSADDLLIDALIRSASALIAQEAGRSTFALQEYEQTSRVRSPATEFMLDVWPVAEVVAVTVNAEALPLASIRVDASAGFLTMLTNSVLTPWPAGETVVRFTAGYVMQGQGRNVPADLERAAISVTRALFFASQRNPQVRSESVEGVGSTSYLDTDRMPIIDPMTRSTIDRYRTPTIG